jgi:hypothetical protein
VDPRLVPVGVLLVGIIRAAGVAVGLGLCLLGTAPGSLADGGTPVVGRIDLNSVYQVSHDGRWLRGVRNGVGEVVLDRQSGAVSALGDDGNANWFVRDNPRFRLSRTGWQIHARDASVYLIDTATGVRTRIDADSRGRPLVPSWRGVEFEFSTEWNDFADSPQLLITSASVSRSGRKAAFCANYDVPAKPFLYLKDLVTGRLTRTKVVCGAVRDETDYLRSDRGPEISDDGRVVHVNGDELRQPTGGPTTGWLSDTLYFTASGKSRSVKGWGTMTRDGRSVLMLVGVHRPGRADRTAGRVGAYDVSTRKITRLPGSDLIYGNDPFEFSAFEQASRRGRFIVNDTSVIDRTYGITSDIRAILRQQGYTPFPTEEPGDPSYLRISGDGTVVVAPVMLPDPQPEVSANAGIYNEVVVTGWQPAVRIALSADPAMSQLVVDVDPDKGHGFWVFQVQRQEPDGSWRTLARKYRTQGSRETRTVDLGAGTCRVRVKAKYGYQSAVSAPVTLAG